jgi:hypothetical protein
LLVHRLSSVGQGGRISSASAELSLLLGRFYASDMNGSFDMPVHPGITSPFARLRTQLPQSRRRTCRQASTDDASNRSGAGNRGVADSGATPVRTRIQKLVSGGQTGADRAALDWAIENGIPHGGWCPAGRRAEDGEIPARYALTETPGRNYQQRTRWNVRDSDGTLIASMSPELRGGSLVTRQIAERLGKPCLHVHPGTENAADAVRLFIVEHQIKVLNVAGPRNSSEPEIEDFVESLLSAALATK